VTVRINNSRTTRCLSRGQPWAGRSLGRTVALKLARLLTYGDEDSPGTAHNNLARLSASRLPCAPQHGTVHTHWRWAGRGAFLGTSMGRHSLPHEQPFSAIEIPEIALALLFWLVGGQQLCVCTRTITYIYLSSWPHCGSSLSMCLNISSPLLPCLSSLPRYCFTLPPWVTSLKHCLPPHTILRCHRCLHISLPPATASCNPIPFLPGYFTSSCP